METQNTLIGREVWIAKTHVSIIFLLHNSGSSQFFNATCIIESWEWARGTRLRAIKIDRYIMEERVYAPKKFLIHDCSG